MTKQPSKKHIRSRFARSLTTYSDNATIQALIAGELMANLRERSGSHYNRILEIGCGSGLFTELIDRDLDYKELFLNDIVEESRSMSENISGSRFIPGDIETLTELPRELDLIVSNAVFQWLHDLPETLERLADSLVPGGTLAFSTFGPDNLYEIRELTDAGLNYYSLAELRRILSDRFELIFMHDKEHLLEMPDPASVLRHIKKTGVNTPTQTIWTKRTLNKFICDYQKRFSHNNGVTLTYQPIIIIARVISSKYTHRV